MANIAPFLEARSVEPWTTKEQRGFKEIISVGRRMNGMKFNVTYGIRPPSEEEEKTKAQSYYRSFRSQASRQDGDIFRKHRMEVRRGFTTFTGDVEDRIRRDAILRLKLARAVVNCSRHYTPAGILLSKFHRLAYLTAIAYGEISYENVGYRARVVEDAEGEL